MTRKNQDESAQEARDALKRVRDALPPSRPAKGNTWQPGDVVTGAADGTVISTASDLVAVLHADGVISQVRFHEVYQVKKDTVDA